MVDTYKMLDEVSGKWVEVKGNDDKASVTFEANLKPNDNTSDQAYRKIAYMDVFKLTDVPKTMRKKGWDIAARLQERWFNNRPYEMPGDVKKKSGKALANYPKDLFVTDEISWDWLFSFPRVVKKYNQLMNLEIYKPKAGQAIITTFKNQGYLKPENFTPRPVAYTVDTSDIQKLHDWQFQRISIDNANIEKLARYVSGVDGLTAAFAGFTLFAAIHQFVLVKIGSYARCYVTSIAIYSIDDYDFLDDKQYLGHWNKNNVKVIPVVQVQSMIGNELQYPIPANAGVLTLQGAYFSVFNHQYRRYREIYKKGGDMLVASPVRTHPVKELYVDILFKT